MTEDRDHLFRFNGGVAVHDGDCWCEPKTSPETDWFLEVTAAAERNRIARGVATPTDRRPIDGDRDE